MALATTETTLVRATPTKHYGFPEAIPYGSGFIVIYTESGTNTFPTATFAQYFDATGKPGFKTKLGAWGNQSPELTNLGGGRILATWQGMGDVDAVIFNAANGRIIASKSLDIKQTDHVNEIVALGNGKALLLVTYSDVSNPFAPKLKTQVFVLDGALKTTPGAVLHEGALTFSSVTKDYWQILDRGALGATVVYLDRLSNQIFAQLLDPNGKATGPKLVVSEKFTVPSFFDSLNQSVKAESLANGSFIVSWAAKTATSDGYDVWFKIIDATGKAKTAAVKVNVETRETQYKPDVILLDGGRFAVTWNELSVEKLSETHMIRFFDANGKALSGELAVNEPPFGVIAAVDTEWVKLTDGSLVEIYSRGGAVYSVGVPKPVFGTAAPETFGTNKADLVLAGAGHDKLNGLAGNDLLSGGLGNDILNGGTGKDVLNGDEGFDVFIFNAPLTANNVDRIMNFSPVQDTIRLENAVIPGLTKLGTLGVAQFKVLGTAGAELDADDRIVYDLDTGILSYDPDGSGSRAAIQFAVVENRPNLTNADFVVI